MKEDTFKYIGDKPWEYLPVVNECIKILLTIGLGILSSNFGILDASKFVPQATRFVFYVALPLHVLKGIGVGVDFYDDTFLWKYIFSFLALRAIALVICMIVVLVRKRRHKPTSHGEETTIGEIKEKLSSKIGVTKSTNSHNLSLKMNNDNTINNESSFRKIVFNDDTITLHDANIKNGRTLELHML